MIGETMCDSRGKMALGGGKYTIILPQSDGNLKVMLWAPKTLGDQISGNSKMSQYKCNSS